MDLNQCYERIERGLNDMKQYYSLDDPEYVHIREALRYLLQSQGHYQMISR